MRFYLGTHNPAWLGYVEVPLFVSHRRLRDRKSFPIAVSPWALDSGGFSELNSNGRWDTSANEYEDAVWRYRTAIGNMDWCAPRDWMCEPWIVQKTGLTIREHQDRTVEDYLDLKSRGLPVIPVLQGWQIEDYVICADLYESAGVDLTAEDTVGLGSVCRRQNTGEAAEIVRTLYYGMGLQLHGFGFKTVGLGLVGDQMKSADSMAWSMSGRYAPPLPGHTHKNCANCLDYALLWRQKMFDSVAEKGVILQ